MRPLNLASLAACVLAGLCGTAEAQLTYEFNTGLPHGGQIPDGNPAGWSDTRALTGLPAGGLLDVNVTLTVAGAYNGDLYGYLVHENRFAVLLNRVGRTLGTPFGYGDAGLSVTFDDEAAATDIHSYQSVGGYSISGGAPWRPDARDIDPATVLDTDLRGPFLNSFVGVDPNGDWTLFLADLSGGETSQVTAWGLVIVVPEPGQAVVLLAAAIYVCGVRRRQEPDR